MKFVVAAAILAFVLCPTHAEFSGMPQAIAADCCSAALTSTPLSSSALTLLTRMQDSYLLVF